MVSLALLNNNPTAFLDPSATRMPPVQRSTHPPTGNNKGLQPKPANLKKRIVVADTVNEKPALLMGDKWHLHRARRKEFYINENRLRSLLHQLNKKKCILITHSVSIFSFCTANCSSSLASSGPSPASTISSMATMIAFLVKTSLTILRSSSESLTASTFSEASSCSWYLSARGMSWLRWGHPLAGGERVRLRDRIWRWQKYYALRNVCISRSNIWMCLLNIFKNCWRNVRDMPGTCWDSLRKCDKDMKESEQH